MMRAAANETILDWLRKAHETTRWTASVCTGSFVLGVAGLLQGKTITTHWASRDYTEEYGGATYAAKRFVRDGKVVTAAGVSAGLDMALFLAADLADQTTAEAIQLALEYDPDPPFDQGAFCHAKPEITQRAIELLYARPRKPFHD